MAAEPRKDIPKDQPPATSAVDELSPAEDFAPAPDTAHERLNETIRMLLAEKQQLTDQLLRKQADIENFRKRTEREKEEFMQYSLFDALKSLLPILDGFELALNADSGAEDYRKGVGLIYQQLSGVLHKMGLRKVESKGQQFDPHLHEAVATVESEKLRDHEIAEELQKGYFFKDRLLRPAMVKVAKHRAGHHHKNA